MFKIKALCLQIAPILPKCEQAMSLDVRIYSEGAMFREKADYLSTSGMGNYRHPLASMR